MVGKQMLTKGHSLPQFSLVVILDADQGLFASDFRATERLAQTITQVAGRAGRGSKPGEVLIKTQFPDHPLLNLLIPATYGGFASTALGERGDAGRPRDRSDLPASPGNGMCDRLGGAVPVVCVDVGERGAGKRTTGEDGRYVRPAEQRQQRVLAMRRHQDDAVGVAVAHVALDP